MMLIKTIFAIFIAAFMMNSYAEINKCTDVNGQISYSSKACDSKSKKESIHIRKAPEAVKEKTETSANNNKTASENQSSDKEKMTQAKNSGQSNETNKIVTEKENNVDPRCDGRIYCSQMTSCEEAMFFLKNCPNVEMDGGKKDGIPCEKQWCSHLVPNKNLD
jgi:hypothetical protein